MEEKKGDLQKIIKDFVNDILKTFPELAENLNVNLKNILENDDEKAYETVIEYCEKVYPERFFDILYQNEDIFKDDDSECFFLPGIDFKYIWKENISDSTRNTLWKYLQLILFTIVSSLSGEESFGDTAKLFEAINKDEFKEKLEDTMRNMKDMFSNTNDSDSNIPDMSNMPSPDDIHEHVNGMLNGKLGKLAKDIAEETAKDFDIDITNDSSVEGVFQNLFKQPNKLMSLVKNVGNKLDEKMKSGDIKESELLEEASELMTKMKNMPGMGNLKDIFGKMGMGGKMDMNAMRNNLNNNMRTAKQRERMREKLEKRQQNMQTASAQGNSVNPIEKTVFSTGEKYEKSAKRPPSGNKKKRKKKK